MVKVDIPGIGEVTAENAASERTLREILKALGGKILPVKPVVVVVPVLI